MYIRTTGSTRELYVDDLVDEPIEFDDDGIARVPARVGDELVDRYDGLVVEEDEREDTDAGDDSPPADNPEDTDEDDSTDSNDSNDSNDGNDSNEDTEGDAAPPDEGDRDTDTAATDEAVRREAEEIVDEETEAGGSAETRAVDADLADEEPATDET